jgi:hypothetical protein
MYNVPTSERILQMSEPTDSTEKPKPFLQRIQLMGKKGSVVRATGQIDDGAMRNCISLDRWEKYGHCLDTLSKSNTIISVANATEIESKGSWTGTVQVGGTGARSRFEIFDCKGAFDVILGKPWLKEVRAHHDYVTDRIIIGKDGRQEVITNILDDNQTTTVSEKDKLTQQTPGENKLAEAHPEEQLSREWTLIAEINASGIIDKRPQKLIQSEARIKQLRNRLDTLHEMTRNTTMVDTVGNSDVNEATVKAIGDVTKEEFKINRGTNTSARVVNTFDEARIQEILKAVEIGPDLVEEQRKQV